MASAEIHILVVEDNAVNRELVEDILTSHGYRVTTAETAPAAIEAVRGGGFALVLMDISLPGMDGLQAVQCLKSQPDTAAIPIIALTAHAMEEDAERSRAAGCVAHVTKPFRVPELLAAVEQALGLAQGREES